MLHGGSHISPAKRQRKVEAYNAPSYHWQGFGRQSSKPEWFDANKDRKPLILWEGDACGAPRIVPKRLGKKAPYNHSSDERLYRPVVPISSKQLTTLIPARAADRQLIERGSTKREKYTGSYVEVGTEEKYQRYTDMSRESRAIYKQNYEKSIYTDMKEMIYQEQAFQPLPYSRTRSDFKVGQPGGGGNSN
ncbi:hypothetical protein TrVE_jg10545 [Triparma verrucosa]|uniref:Uncharacterized protein n=2 Tax=Triparma TaxID=722752 RepID=A0A9W7F4U3_9STRA|nr:hypothetical protein TrST_g11555 [Triparma strigata]GMI14585.1 hypothetical protein TrVE_jg10545 [Triparma verrucosa]